MRHDPLRRYNVVAQALHWTVVALIGTQYWLAWRFHDLPLSPGKIGLIANHKSVGMSVLVLVVFRLAWRLATKRPELPDTLKPYERVLGQITHWGFYVLLLAVPMSGWLMSSYANFSVSYFGLFTWPDIVAADKERLELFKEIHEALNYLLMAFIALHLIAVLKHVFVLRDRVVYRMLP